MKKIIFIISIAITFLLISDLIWWIYVFETVNNFEQSKIKYLSIFPFFLSSVGTLTLLELFLGALVLSIFGYFIAKKIYFIPSLIMLILNAFIFCLHLYG
jgi:hypothetical protein